MAATPNKGYLPGSTSDPARTPAPAPSNGLLGTDANGAGAAYDPLAAQDAATSGHQQTQIGTPDWYAMALRSQGLPVPETVQRQDQLTPEQQQAMFEGASKGTAQIRNPYDYLIGRDPNYVGNMAAQQQTLGAATQEGYNSLVNQAAGAQQAGATMQGMGTYAADYGQVAANGINAGAAGLAGYGNALMAQGAATAGRAGPQLNFAEQSGALGGSLGLANQLAAQRQGPSAAQAMLRQGANQSMAQSLALARSGRGFGGSAAGQAQALQQNAATMQGVANQAAMLRAQEDQAFRAQQAQNLAQAANIYQGAGGQYGQQQALGAQTALQSQQQNDAFGAQLYGLGLQGQNAALGAQVQAGQLGLSGIQSGAGIYGQGAQLQNQGTQLQGALWGQGAQAASQGNLNAFGFNQAQNNTDVSRENMITQDYGIRSGVGIANQQAANQQNAALMGAIGTGAGALIGSLGGPAGTAAGAALGGAAGAAAYNASNNASDERVKRDVAPVSMSDAYRALEGPPAVDMRPAQGYTYEYKDPQRFGQGRFSGPMAQDLERSPATSGTVYTDTDGVKKIDTSRLALVNTSAISEQQRRLDELEQALREYEVGRTRGVASDRRAKTKVKPAGRYRAPSSEPEEPPVTSGRGFRFADFYRDTSPSETVVDARKSHEPRSAEARNAARFEDLERTAHAARPLPKTSPVKAFARNAAAHALDTAALPVTLAGAGLEALGYPNAAAHLDANEALESADWLYQRREPDDYRHYVAEERDQNPAASALGAAVGDTVGGAGIGGLTERGLGAAVSMAKRGASKVAKTVKPSSTVPAASKSWDEMPRIVAEPTFPPEVARAKGFLERSPDAEALRNYMRSDYRGVNDTLRGDAGLPIEGYERIPEHVRAEYRDQGRRIGALLDSAEAAGHATPGMIQRGTELSEDALREWLERGAVENRAPWSATTDPSVAKMFGGGMFSGGNGGRKVLLNLEQKSGVPVSGLMPNRNESEVLLGPGKKWEVRGHRVDPDSGRTVVDLAQVDQFKPGTVPALSLAGEAEATARGKVNALARAPAADRERRYRERSRRKAGGR